MQVEKDYVKDLEIELSEYKKRIRFLEAQLNSVESKPNHKPNNTSTLNEYNKSHQLVEYAYYPTALIDKRNNVININKQFERFFGYRR